MLTQRISNFKRDNFIAPKIKLHFILCKNVDRYTIYSDAEYEINQHKKADVKTIC